MRRDARELYAILIICCRKGKKECVIVPFGKLGHCSRKVSHAQTLLVAELRRTWEVKRWTSPEETKWAERLGRTISMISRRANLTNFDSRIQFNGRSHRSALSSPICEGIVRDSGGGGTAARTALNAAVCSRPGDCIWHTARWRFEKIKPSRKNHCYFVPSRTSLVERTPSPSRPPSMRPRFPNRFEPYCRRKALFPYIGAH